MQIDVIGGFPISEEDWDGMTPSLDPEFVLMVHCATQLVAKGMSEHAAVASVGKIMDAAQERLYS
jgi:hypothetical protein